MPPLLGRFCFCVSSLPSHMSHVNTHPHRVDAKAAKVDAKAAKKLEKREGKLAKWEERYGTGSAAQAFPGTNESQICEFLIERGPARG